MLSSPYPDPEYPTKQSAGYMFVKLLVVQLLFIAFCVVLIFSSDSTISYPIPNFTFLSVSLADVMLILWGVIVNFILFILIFASWQSTEYSISSPHLYIKNRVMALFKSESIIDLSVVEGYEVFQSFLGKIFQYGTIRIHFYKDKRTVKIKGVPFPNQFLTYLKTQTRQANKKIK